MKRGEWVVTLADEEVTRVIRIAWEILQVGANVAKRGFIANGIATT
jgi:hypothetical protein